MSKFTPLLLVAFVVLILGSCLTTQKSTTVQDQQFADQVLLQYGEHIYQRELCGSCHTQQIEKESPDLFSLDGLGGKYSNEWLYLFLQEPEALIVGSSMSPYPHLYTELLNRDTLEELTGKRRRSISADSLWNALTKQAEAFSEPIQNKYYLSDSITEVFVLMAYLQGIPRSKLMQERDSVAHTKIISEIEERRNTVLDSNSVVLEIARNNDNIPKGAQLFKAYCSVCHGQEAGGGIGPNLTDEYWLHGGTDLAIARTITYGVPEKGMIAWSWSLTEMEIGELVAFVFSLQGTNPLNSKAPQGTKE